MQIIAGFKALAFKCPPMIPYTDPMPSITRLPSLSPSSERPFHSLNPTYLEGPFIFLTPPPRLHPPRFLPLFPPHPLPSSPPSHPPFLHTPQVEVAVKAAHKNPAVKKMLQHVSEQKQKKPAATTGGPKGIRSAYQVGTRMCVCGRVSVGA